MAISIVNSGPQYPLFQSGQSTVVATTVKTTGAMLLVISVWCSTVKTIVEVVVNKVMIEQHRKGGFCSF